jgi:hypothetical protein
MLADVRRLSASVDDLLADAERREPFVNPDGRSTSVFERVWIGGEPHIVKYIHPDDDFMLRTSSDRSCRAVTAWAEGLLDASAEFVDHATVGAALGHGRDGLGGAVLMRDVSDELLPGDGSVIPADQHRRFLDDVAGMCASTWGFRDGPDGPGLIDYEKRWAFFGHRGLAGEEALGWPERVPQIAAEGWQRFAERAPADLAQLVDRLLTDPAPLATALRRTPSCLLHGDVKASNAGRSRDGRTLLVDWAYVGEGPACHELTWHLALDRSRLPVSKEEVIHAYRDALEGHGIDTGPWWDEQLALCLLGAVVQLGWEKALGDEEELAWWCEAARGGAARL